MLGPPTDSGIFRTQGTAHGSGLPGGCLLVPVAVTTDICFGIDLGVLTRTYEDGLLTWFCRGSALSVLAPRR